MHDLAVTIERTSMGRDREKDLVDLVAMQHGDIEYVAWSEEGGGGVHRIYDTYILFYIPQYGGEPSYAGTFGEPQLEKLLKMAYSWT